jgi:dihydroorotate dehydrogenase electron transfer subunit
MPVERFPLLHDAPLVNSVQLAPSIWVHEYEAPVIAEHARPGHFVHIKVSQDTAPLLRRPLSILDTNAEKGTFRIVFKVVGAGTQILAGKRIGEVGDILGPLGTCFEPETYGKKLVFVAGGIGMVPLYYLAKELKKSGQNPDIEIDYWFGARSADEIYLLDELRQWCCRVEPVTEDGSLGKKGRVTHFAESDFQHAETIITCGPNPMMADLQRRVVDWSMTKIASMESFMGCGLGACLGCVVPTQDGLQRVCTEGPVFPLDHLVFE